MKQGWIIKCTKICR